MDPLSVAAVLLPVSKSICTTIKDLEDIRKRIQNAPTLLADLISECHITETVTQKLSGLMHSPSANRAQLPQSELHQCFERCQTVISPMLAELRSESHRLRASKDSKLAKSSGFGFWNSARVVWHEDFLREVLESIRAWRSQIQFILQGFGLEADLNLQAGMQIMLQRTQHLSVGPSSPYGRSSGFFLSAELQEAISSSNLREVERLLMSRADPNALPDTDETPLSCAVEKGVDCNIVRCLIYFRARLDSRSSFGETPLHLAVKNGNVPAVRALIDSGAGIDDVDDYMETPLYKAAVECSFDAVQCLLSKRADPCAQDERGVTPLLAVLECFDVDEVQTAHERLNIVRKLITVGADPLHGDSKSNHTPLHAAARRGFTRELELMVRKVGHGNVDPESTAVMQTDADENENENENDGDGTDPPTMRYTPLMYAAELGHAQAVQTLIKAGANVNYADVGGIWTDDHLFTFCPLGCASESKDLKIVEMLLDAGADPQLQDGLGNTPLFHVVSCAWPVLETVKLLVARGADVTHRNHQNASALHEIASDAAAADFLLQQGGQQMMEWQDDTGQTPLLCVASTYYGFHLKIAMLFLNKWGANVHTADKDGTNCVMRSCVLGNTLSAAFFLGRGVDIDTKDHGGATALHYAAANGESDVCEWLLELGIDRAAVTSGLTLEEEAGVIAYGTAADVARQQEHYELAQLIDDYSEDATGTIWTMSKMPTEAEDENGVETGSTAAGEQGSGSEGGGGQENDGAGPDTAEGQCQDPNCATCLSMRG